jgi:hypothetical protein
MMEYIIYDNDNNNLQLLEAETYSYVLLDVHVTKLC